MEATEVTRVLASASELQLKIEAALRRASRADHLQDGPQYEDDSADDDDNKKLSCFSLFPDAQKLKAILDALLHLQDHLHCLQILYKQQKSEREHFLSELEEQRKALIRRVREYNGTEWELVQEAHAFAGVAVQSKNDLMLPPYQSHAGDMLEIGETKSLSRRASFASRPKDEAEPSRLKETIQQCGQKATTQPKHRSSLRLGLADIMTRAGKAVGFSAKSALVIVSVLSIFALSHLEPHLRRRAAKRSLKRQSYKGGSNYQVQTRSNSGSPVIQNGLCPPGKVLLMQDGVQKCFVKERVEAPFKDVIKQPDASYGYG